ncbi:hypothetical protein [Roseospira goensis]|uniref:Peptidase n=1 Tax=Roseospira goensis TaxID=391922 RepID=A0A7W6RXH9_9PROT|nr:hypothetical protein [Roseospira goensis]MBB4284397.1 hypothetical protein [Roseospira goensis]
MPRRPTLRVRRPRGIVAPVRAVLAVLILAGLILAGGLAAPAVADWKDEREALDQRRLSGPYAIFHTEEGPHAFPARRRNAHLAGYYLDRLEERLALADRVYQRDLGLAPPLTLPRYAGGARIDVHIYDIGRGMGSTGDELHRFDYDRFGEAGPALTVSLSHRWHPPNLTPEHEVFHVYQYAYTYFKNSWYLEGMARALESLFRDRPAPTEPLPADDAALDAWLGRSYAAAPVWTRLFRRCQPGCTQVAEAAGGPPGAVCGRAVVRPLLEALDRADDAVAAARGLDGPRWPEKQQRAAANTGPMLAALAEVVAAHCPVSADPDLARFQRLLTARAAAAAGRAEP